MASWGTFRLVAPVTASPSGATPLGPRGNKRQQQAAATAEQLLRAARDVFETRGYQGATVGAITEAANTAHGTFYLYFSNKEDVFAKVIGSILELMWLQTEVSDAGEPYDELLRANRAFLDVFTAHRGLWRCLHEGMHQSLAIRSLWSELRRPFVERIARDLRRIEAQRRPPRGDGELQLTAYALASMAEWLAFTYAVLEDPSPSDVSLDDLARTMTGLWFAGPPV